MKTKKVRELRWRRVSDKELGYTRMTFIHCFSHSPDPFVSATYLCPFAPFRELVAKERERTGKKISVNHILNKLFAIIITKIPNMNWCIVDNKVYAIQDINIGNAVMLPNTENELVTVVLDNPHKKSLEQIHDDFNAERQRIIEMSTEENLAKQVRIAKILVRFGLFKLLGEKRTFKMLYEYGPASNINFTNASFGGPAAHIGSRFANNFTKMILRLAVHGYVNVPAVEDGKLVNKEMLPVGTMFDHRLLDGVHHHLFGKALNEIANNLEEYMLSTDYELP